MIKSRKMKQAGYVASMEQVRNVYKIVIGNPEGKRPLGRPWCRWEDNSKINFREIESDDCGLEPYASGQGPMAGSCEHGNESSGPINARNLTN
jgi:hypothetical protein